MKISIFDKILILLVAILVITLLFPLQSKALSSILQSGDNFLSAGGLADNIDEAKLQSTSKKVYQALMVIATIIAVIIGAILGFQFITASVEGKAKVQEALVPYIAGCIVVFGSFFIWKTLVNTGNGIEGNPAERSSRLTVGVDEGTVDVAELSNDDLKRLWSNNAIDSTIATAVKGTASDPRSGGRGTPGVSVDVAINNLSAVNKKIYDECNKRGLIERYVGEYYENGNKKTATFVRLK